MKKALSGIKSIKLSTFKAVAACARHQAVFWAKVIKVEPLKGDKVCFSVTSEGRPGSSDESSTFDLEKDRKLSPALNLKLKKEKEIPFKLLHDSAALLTNRRLQSLAEFTLAYENLKNKFLATKYNSCLGNFRAAILYGGRPYRYLSLASICLNM
ncbi:MAG: hypothetical protein GX044_09670 [Firmicutes bacterium]|nr:hypothetical protein [Bacillota bacterium]